MIMLGSSRASSGSLPFAQLASWRSSSWVRADIRLRSLRNSSIDCPCFICFLLCCDFHLPIISLDQFPDVLGDARRERLRLIELIGRLDLTREHEDRF